jgi:hypothetical protein
MERVGIGSAVNWYGVLVLGDLVVIEESGRETPAIPSKGWAS